MCKLQLVSGPRYFVSALVQMGYRHCQQAENMNRISSPFLTPMKRILRSQDILALAKNTPANRPGGNAHVFDVR